MYSRQIEGMLQKKGIAPGDEVKITSDKREFEGVLIPRSEFGDENVLVIKLKNGYNIGVRFGRKDRITKKGSARETFSLPKIEVKRREDLSDVAIIATGGTIGSRVDYATGGVHAVIDPREVLHQIPELQDIANFEIHSPMRLMSEDIVYRNWQELARSVAKAVSKSHGVVIMHGTDTMHYTSAALSFMLQGLNGPVVLTGAQRSSDRGSSDFFLNLVCSARIAARSNIAEVGICMHANSSDNFCNFMRGTKVRKMHTTRRDAFKPINSKAIARVGASGTIEYLAAHREITEESAELRVIAGYDPRVALLKFYPNADPDIIEYYIGKGYRGLIIEGTGMGHVAVSPGEGGRSWLGPIKRAVDAGVVVGMTSQCLNGRVNTNVYSNLRLISKAGAIYCEDMLPEVALIKLGFLLGNHRRSEAARLLNKNIAGEISERSEVDWFQ